MTEDPHLEPREIVASGAQAFLQTIEDDERMTEMVVLVLRQHGVRLTEQVTASDRASALVPADVLIDGREQPGAVLVLQNRVIFVWMTGTFRAKTFLEVVPRESITDVREETEGGRSSLLITAHRTWKLSAFRWRKKPFEITFLHGLLSGWITPRLADSRSES